MVRAHAGEPIAGLAGYRLVEEGRSPAVTGHYDAATLEVRPGHWLVRDDDGIRVVPAYELFSRYRTQPVE